MAGVIDKYFGVHAQALQVWNRRAELLASNIANADTPHYKAKDIDFEIALSSAKSGSGKSVHLETTNTKHIGPSSANGMHVETKYRIPLQPSLDGNTVDSQVEHGLFAENAVRHQVSLQFLSNKISSLVKTLREE